MRALVPASLLLMALAWSTSVAARPATDPAPAPSDPAALIEELRLEVARARAEADRARAEADRARAEADRARAEADRARGEVRVPVPTAPPHPPRRYLVASTREGLFLRFTAGGGYGGVIARGTTHSPGARHAPPYYGGALTNPSEDGLSEAFTFLMGGVIGPNLIAHCFVSSGAFSPDSQGLVWMDAGHALLGAGLTWYAMPLNVYVTLAPGFDLTWFRFHDARSGWEEIDESSRRAYGVGGILALGKEWWVAPRWSLGVAIELEYAWSHHEDLDLHRLGGRLAFSATFN